MEEIKINQKRIVNIIFPVLIFSGFIFSYWTVLYKMTIRWSTGDNNYCYLVLPLFVYLLWDRRRRFSFAELSWDYWGLVPILFSLVLIIIGELGSVETLIFTGIWGCVTGVAYLLYGCRIRHLIFPLIILFFIVPLPPLVNRMLTFDLKMAASTLSVFMLRASGVSVFLDGNIIDLGISQMQVVDACSGLRYLMPLLLMSLLVGYFFSKRFWRRAILLILAIPISVILNSFRIWITGILTVNGYAELAENLFHDFTGWLIFMIAGVLLYITTLFLNRIGSNPADRSIKDVGGYRSGLLRPLVLTAIICLAFVTSGWTLKEIPSARNLPTRIAFKSFPMQISDWQGKRSYISKEILDQLWADDYVQVAYFNPKTGNTIYLLIPFYEYQGTRHTAHAPQACLLGGGWALTQSQERMVSLDDGNQINIMTMNLKKGNAKILGSYFFLQRGRVVTSPWMNKYYLMWDSITKGRTDGAIVRAEMVLAPGQTVNEAWVVLEGFIAELWKLLPQYVPM